MPAFVVPEHLVETPIRVTPDHALPERRRRAVLELLPHLPAAAKALEQPDGSVFAYAMAAILSHHEELRHVVDAIIAGESAATVHEREAGQLVVDTYHEW